MSVGVKDATFGGPSGITLDFSHDGEEPEAYREEHRPKGRRERLLSGAPTCIRTSQKTLLQSVQAEVDHLKNENEAFLRRLGRQHGRVSLPTLGETEQLLEERRRAQEDLQAELVDSLERNSCWRRGVRSWRTV